jgi:streptomycin 6-kinase
VRRIPSRLSDPGETSRHPARASWLRRLPELIDDLAAEWRLEVGEPYEPGGTSAWIAPALGADGQDLVLKVGWRHMEAEEEADGLRVWNGDGAVRCLAARKLEDTQAMLLERCRPGVQLRHAVSEPEQDVVIARLLRRLWAHKPPEAGPFRPLQEMCDYWAEVLEADIDALGPADGLARQAAHLLRELPASAGEQVLLCTDLHAENVLSAEREPWLVIDPKPFVGDPAFDVVQHMLNCRRLIADPAALVRRMADLLDLDPERVRLWLFARCAQEGLRDPGRQGVARRIYP